jgi:hypothetical protein
MASKEAMRAKTVGNVAYLREQHQSAIEAFQEFYSKAPQVGNSLTFVLCDGCVVKECEMTPYDSVASPAGVIGLFVGAQEGFLALTNIAACRLAMRQYQETADAGFRALHERRKPALKLSAKLFYRMGRCVSRSFCDMPSVNADPKRALWFLQGLPGTWPTGASAHHVQAGAQLLLER